jgi:hypothetical protein
MEILTLISNLSYLIIGLYLIYKDYYLYGGFTLIMWSISHIYHTDTNNDFWSMLDEIVATATFIFVLIKCFKTLMCFKFISLLVLLLIIHYTARYYFNNKDIYNIIHSIWHIFSGLFVLHLFLTHENNNN